MADSRGMAYFGIQADGFHLNFDEIDIEFIRAWDVLLERKGIKLTEFLNRQSQ